MTDKNRNRIFTLNDARKQREHEEYLSERRLALREAKAKVARWERKYKQFGGEVQLNTLNRMKANLSLVQEM